MYAGGYVLIGCQNKDKYPQHHPDFYVDDPAMEKAFELVNKVFLKINGSEKMIKSSSDYLPGCP